MSQVEQKGNKMGYMPIPKLLFQISFPIMISMMVQAFYNIIDSIFVAKINENALTAVSLAFPLQTLLIAISVGTGVGVNALLSRHLGEGNIEEANETGKNGIFLAFISAIVFAVVSGIAIEPFVHFQTKDAQIFQYTTSYLYIVCLGCIGVFLEIMFERILQSTGLSIYTMISQGFGAIINIVLDPILIFGLLGMPKMGIMGAATATITGQFSAMFLSFYFNHHFNKELNLKMKGFRPDKTIIRGIYEVGIPSIIMQAIGSVMTFGMNKILIQFTPTATAVFGVYFKLNSFIFMPIFGLNNGMVPIVAFNYGANNKKRVVQTIKIAVAASMIIMAFGWILFMAIPAQLLGLFKASEDMLRIGVPALRIICQSFLFAGYCITIGAVFQALGNGMYSLINSFCRQLIVILPVAFLLAKFGGLSAIWWAIPIAEISSVVLSTYFFKKIYKERIAGLA